MELNGEYYDDDDMVQKQLDNLLTNKFILNLFYHSANKQDYLRFIADFFISSDLSLLYEQEHNITRNNFTIAPKYADDITYATNDLNTIEKIKLEIPISYYKKQT